MGIDARLDVIGLVVADMAASLAFYRRLGLDIPADADGRRTWNSRCRAGCG
jgi:catechol 2,3-dioxygenase-like lactoylglutathione lyase family enzyme